MTNFNAACKSGILTLLILYSLSLFSQVSENMDLLGQWDDPTLPSFQGLRYNDIWGYEDTINNRSYAIVGTSRSTLFIEITDPTQPILRDSIAGEHTRCVHRDFKVYGDYAYGVADQGASTLQIFDLSELPNRVNLVYNSDEYFNRCHNIFIDTDAGRLYAVGTNTLRQGVYVFDIATDPENPVLLSDINFGQYTHDIYVRNDTAWLSNGTNGFYVFDYSDAANPELLGSLPDYPEAGYNHSSWLSKDGKYAVMADETHGKSMKVVSVEDLSQLSVVSLFKSALLSPADEGSIPHNPFIVGDYVVISYYHDGIQVYDVSDPLNPTRAAYYDTYPENNNYSGFDGCWGAYPFESSGIILASDIEHGLFVFHTQFAFPEDITSEVETKNISCFNDNNGEISLSPKGGGNLFTIDWSNGFSGTEQMDLSSGKYYFTVTDQWGFSLKDSVEIIEPDEIIISAISSDNLCIDDLLGRVDIDIKGGTAPYSINWSNGLMDTISIDSLSNGIYTADIIDAQDCKSVISDTVTNSIDMPVSDFDFEILDGVNDCKLVLYNKSMNFNELKWDLDFFGLSGMPLDTINVSDGEFEFCLEVRNECGDSTVCKTIEIECLTSSTETADYVNFKVYPIPTRDIINIEFENSELRNISVRDALGRTVITKESTSNSSFLNSSHLTAGIYWLVIEDSNSVQTRTIQIQR